MFFSLFLSPLANFPLLQWRKKSVWTSDMTPLFAHYAPILSWRCCGRILQPCGVWTGMHELDRVRWKLLEFSRVFCVSCDSLATLQFPWKYMNYQYSTDDPSGLWNESLLDLDKAFRNTGRIVLKSLSKRGKKSHCFWDWYCSNLNDHAHVLLSTVNLYHRAIIHATRATWRAVGAWEGSQHVGDLRTAGRRRHQCSPTSGSGAVPHRHARRGEARPTLAPHDPLPCLTLFSEPRILKLFVHSLGLFWRVS